jgi:hypothetical protein
VYTARLLLAHGRLLRRTGQRRLAVERLRQANHLYLGLRAARFLARTGSYGASSGNGPSRPRSDRTEKPSWSDGRLRSRHQPGRRTFSWLRESAGVVLILASFRLIEVLLVAGVYVLTSRRSRPRSRVFTPRATRALRRWATVTQAPTRPSGRP